MRRFFFLITLLMFTFSLSAKEALFHVNAKRDYIPAPLFSPKDKSSFLPQVPKVNLITGEYCEDACDLIVAGIEPLSVRRFYNHFSGHDERIYGHWRINPEAFMFFNFEAYEGSRTFTAVGERNSCFFLYEQSVDNGFGLDVYKNKSFTNASSLLSGQNHPLNTHVSYTKGHSVRNRPDLMPADYYWWEGKIKDGSGRERIFKTDVRQWPQAGKGWPCRSWKRSAPLNDHVPFEVVHEPLAFRTPFQAQITEESRPNGNVIRYEYEDFNASNPEFDHDLPTTYMLKSIKAYSQKGLLLGSIEIAYASLSPIASFKMDGIN